MQLVALDGQVVAAQIGGPMYGEMATSGPYRVLLHRHDRLETGPFVIVLAVAKRFN
jgi:hypothetical protein